MSSERDNSHNSDLRDDSGTRGKSESGDALGPLHVRIVRFGRRALMTGPSRKLAGEACHEALRISQRTIEQCRRPSVRPPSSPVSVPIAPAAIPSGL